MSEESEQTDALTRMVGTSPYHDTTIQPWEVWASWELNPWEANIVKRIQRYRRDGGKGVEDLRKAAHELEYLIETCPRP